MVSFKQKKKPGLLQHLTISDIARANPEDLHVEKPGHPFGPHAERANIVQVLLGGAYLWVRRGAAVVLQARGIHGVVVASEW